MRPIQIMDLPVVYPRVCIKCGLGQGRRHFVDLGVDADIVEKDPVGTVHLREGTIYLCNMCMTGMISEYLGKLFEFIDNADNADRLFRLQHDEQIDRFVKEIWGLQKNLESKDNDMEALRAEIAGLKADKEIKEETTETTAEELMEKMLGEPATGTSDRTADGRDSDAEGTDKSPDGNDPATELTFSISDIVSPGFLPSRSSGA